jgi:hypothetical protein
VVPERPDERKGGIALHASSAAQMAPPAAREAASKKPFFFTCSMCSLPCTWEISCKLAGNGSMN